MIKQTDWPETTRDQQAAAPAAHDNSDWQTGRQSHKSSIGVIKISI